MEAASITFLGICVIVGAFIIISVRAFQIYPELVRKIFKYMVIAGIAVVFSIAAVAIGLRLSDRNSSSFSRSYKSVAEIWGGEISQGLPMFQTANLVEEQYLAEKNEQYKTRFKKIYTPFSFASHAAEISVASNIRQKGLLKFAGYNLSFKGHYTCTNTASKSDTFYFTFPLPGNAGNISDLKVLLNGKEFSGNTDLSEGIKWSGMLAPAEKVSFDISYSAQGTGSFTYGKTTYNAGTVTNLSVGKISIASFGVILKTDFRDVTIIDGTMAPQENHSDKSGSLISWKGSNLILDQGIGLKFEISANYGMLFSKIFFYAPLVIFLFLASMLIFTTAKGIRLHPMHYGFITAGFFTFYLLGSYIVTYIHIFPAIALSLATSTAITWYYTHAIGIGRSVEKVTVMSIVVFQWFFSAAFFFPEHTGILITAASIIALIVLMKLTAKTNWEDKW